MPRTKRIKESETTSQSLVSVKKEKISSKLESALASLDSDVQTILYNWDVEYNKLTLKIKNESYVELMKFSDKDRMKTLAELRKEQTFSDTTFMSSVSILNQFNNSKMTSTVTKQKNTDEGYLTTESGRSSSCDRPHTGRPRGRQPFKSSLKGAGISTTKRQSRSLSRSKMNKTVTLQMPAGHSFKTPSEKRMPPPSSFGFVTPKVKPNTPLTVLRHPKQGETVISMQGSPLLVSGIVTDRCASVNIPLNDGRLLSLQPKSGLRLSQLPELDDNTRQQLVTLRDNLTKACQLAFK